MTRQNDNHSPEPGRLVRSSHQRSELSNTILGTFGREDKRVWKCIPIINCLGEKATLIACNSKWDSVSSVHIWGERGGSVVECRTPEREVRGSRPTSAVLCPWARHFTPRKYWLITQEAMAPSRHDWKIVDRDVKPQHKKVHICVFCFNGLLWFV